MSNIQDLQQTEMLLTTLIILCVIYVVYILGGAALFMVIEIRPVKSETIKISITESEVFRKFADDNPCVPPDTIKTFVAELIAESGGGEITTTNITQKDEKRNWSFDESIFYVITVITTIGFGNIYPVTSGGKIFFFFYALHGIPLTAVVLIGLGERIVKPYNTFERRQFTNLPKCELYIKRVITILTTYTVFSIIPAVIFAHVEGWTFLDSWYFTMVTLTTVGFGDFIPARGRDGSTGVLYKVLIGIWVFFGLAWLSCVLSVISNQMTESSKVIDTKITEEVCSSLKKAEIKTNPKQNCETANSLSI